MKRWRGYWSENINRKQILWVAGALIVALVPLVVLREMVFQPGYPYTRDALSNLIPPWHARHSFLSGQLPIYTDLWYGGRPQYQNPLWKGLYPPAWPLFIPGIPMFPAIKTILAVHYVAAGLVAYYYASRDFSPIVGVAFGILAIVPMTEFVGHYEKVFGWPWAILIIANLLPHRFSCPRAGYLIGGGLGAMLLAGDNYHFFYFGIFVAIMLGATKAWHQLKPLTVGGIIGLPKFLFAILPTVLGETSRPEAGRVLSVWEIGVGVVGFWIDASALTVELSTKHVFEGFAPVGIGVPILASLVVVYAYFRPPESWQFAAGAVISGIIGVVLATRWETLQSLPIFSTFRVSARAIVLISGATLFLSWLGVLWSGDRRTVVQYAVLALVLISALSGAGTFAAVENAQATQLHQGIEMADSISVSDCDSIWIEGRYEQTSTPYKKPLAYELTKRGVALQATNYGKIGQEYTAIENGEPTFDALVIGKPMPASGTVGLTGGWGFPQRGEVPVELLQLDRVYTYSAGSVYIYTTAECSIRE
jgi:hypothetical protein